MRQIDLSYYSMFRMVNDLMKRNKLIWKDNQLIVDCVDELDTNIKLISKASLGLQNKPSKVTFEKKEIRLTSNKQAFVIKEGLRLYYTMNDMNEEKLMFTFPISRFTKMTDGNFYMEASHIVERAETLSSQLIPIGVTPIKTADLKANLLKFYNKPPEREFTAKTHAALVKLIPAKVKETRLMLRDVLDALLLMYDDDTNHFFVSLYKRTRHRDAKPGRHKYYTVLVKGNVKDVETKLALSDVAVEVGVKKKKVISGEDGFYKVRIYTKDADTITFTKEGYETLTVNIPKKQVKHEVVVNVGMKKVVAV